MKILVIDNYDSFTYNLVYLFKQNKIEVDVIRNDKITPQDCLKYDGIVLSPGPGIPKEAGNMPEIIIQCAAQVPMLGICLGHQAIAEYLGAELINRENVLHGIQTPILLNEKDSRLFKGIEPTFLAGRYHSWEINHQNLPKEIEVTALAEDHSIMALEVKEKHLYGLQFHPESIMTPSGDKMIQNFIEICKNNQV